MTGSANIETKTVRLWLDADLIHWFKTQAGGKRGYQTAINAALRKVVEEEMRERSTAGGNQP